MMIEYEPFPAKLESKKGSYEKVFRLQQFDSHHLILRKLKIKTV